MYFVLRKIHLTFCWLDWFWVEDLEILKWFYVRVWLEMKNIMFYRKCHDGHNPLGYVSEILSWYNNTGDTPLARINIFKTKFALHCILVPTDEFTLANPDISLGWKEENLIHFSSVGFYVWTKHTSTKINKAGGCITII